jgi:ceramide glucosyltransferase
MWSWAALAIALILRLAVAFAVGGNVLRDPQVSRYFSLIPLRDLIAVAVWIASLGGHTVVWRGETFELKDGKLRRVER